MKITIKSIHLVNFKGVRDFSATFNPDTTEFRGDNATGKTTLFDAFTWCLYDKDSFGRSNFQIKTLTPENEVIWDIPHEVTIVLDVDGQEVSIRKVFKEIWQKKRGKSESEFTGHSTDRFWNDVPVKEKEFNEKISEICDEETFRLITNPLYFLTNLDKKKQRNFLINMAGEITPESIAVKFPEFQSLVNEMSGKTADEFEREIAAKIKRIKTENETLPARIDERKRDVPESENWEFLQNMIDAKQTKIQNLEKQKNDIVAAFNAATEEQRKRVQAKSDLEIQLTVLRVEIEKSITKDFYAKQSEQNTLKERESQLLRNVEIWQNHIKDFNEADQKEAEKRETLLAEYHELQKRHFDRDAIDRSTFVCPTCKRQLDESDIDAQIDTLEKNYNAETARLLDENKRKGLAVKKTREDIAVGISNHQSGLVDLKNEIDAIHKNPLFSATLEKPDTTGIETHEEVVALKKKIADAENEIQTHVVSTPDNAELDTQISAERSEIENLKVRLGKKEVIERNEKRIAELEKQFKTQNEEIALLEGVQFKIAEFKKTLIGEVENTINAMFSLVKFKIYEQQINGGERETCEALVDGVPYSTNVNTAARVNAGLDIINAISEYSGVFAPIFVDNRESVTTLIETKSQIINLVKDENYSFLTKI